MKKIQLLVIAIIFLSSCQESATKGGTLVTNSEELEQAIAEAKPGGEIIMSNGTWTDLQIKFVGFGIENAPITLRAETPGEVIIQGVSDLKIGGEYLVVDGLYFTNGYAPSDAVIQYAINDDTVANHSRVTNCVIKDFNKSQRNMQDLWVLFMGRYNQLDRCYLAGKANRGPTVRVDLAGNKSIKNYHKINNNYFGPRPPKGGPSAETIQIGNSFTSMAPSYTLVENNLFDRCNGEVEVISSKTNFNEFRNNVFYKSEGSLVTRHGNYCIIDGNYFIGDESENIGGVRLIGSGHWVTNNYFYNLKGKVFRSPLAVMNGIPKSPLNRYIQVTDVVVAYNSWINCTSPLQFGVGSNVDQKDVLPASEIRSARPIRTLMANNLIYNEKGDEQPIVAHDKLDGVDFKSNVINNQQVEFDQIKGFMTKDFSMTALEENVLVPVTDLSDVAPYEGFEFDQIKADLLGDARSKNNSVGATSGLSNVQPNIMDKSKYGPSWYSVDANNSNQLKTYSAATSADLEKFIDEAIDGETIELASGNYEVKASLKIDKTITIQSADSNNKASILYSGAEGSPAFEMNPEGKLTLKNINLEGTNKQYAFASLKENMSSLYNLTLDNCEVANFKYILKAFKYSFSEFIKLNGSVFKNCENGFELSAEDDDKGDYNAENILIDNCTFMGIEKNVIDYYRGGYDESTVGGNFIVTNSTFTGCGAKEENGILLNTYGIINVDISGNTFHNNKVKAVAQLWGAKNNTHANNEIMNSGKIVVEQNLTMKLMY